MAPGSGCRLVWGLGMASRGLHRVPEDARAWLGRISRPGPYPPTAAQIELRRRWLIGVSAVVALLIAIFIGHAIGSSGVGDADSARQAGTAEGERRGAAAGTREGYRSAFEPARERAYREAYRQAYLAAYRGAFDDAGLTAPTSVKVPTP